MPAKKHPKKKKKLDNPLGESAKTPDESSLLPSEEEQVIQAPIQNRKRKRGSSTSTEIKSGKQHETESKKPTSSRANKQTHITKKENAIEYVNKIYEKEKVHIDRRNAMLEKYIPDSRETKPKDMTVFKISDCSQKDFNVPIDTLIAVEYRIELFLVFYLT